MATRYAVQSTETHRWLGDDAGRSRWGDRAQATLFDTEDEAWAFWGSYGSPTSTVVEVR